jgi:hypothetical protein
MNSILEATEMEGLSLEQQARKAILHVLYRAKENWEVGYHLGAGTQSFALLTEAYHSLKASKGQMAQSLADFRRDMAPTSEKPAAIEIVRRLQGKARDWQIYNDRDGESSSRDRELIEVFLQELGLVEKKEEAA